MILTTVSLMLAQGPSKEVLPSFHFSAETWTLEEVTPGVLLKAEASQSSALTYPCRVLPYQTVAPSATPAEHTPHPPQLQG